MLILKCGYQKVLSEDNYLRIFADGLLKNFLDESPGCRVLAVSVENYHVSTHPAVAAVVVTVPGWLPFKSLYEKRQVRKTIKVHKPELVVSFNQHYAPGDYPEIIFITDADSCRLATNTRSVFVLSDYISRQLRTGAVPVRKLSPFAGLFCKPLTWDRREYIKQSFAKGREFFLCSAFQTPVEQLTIVLKAFSLFKKWQNSHMKLLISEVGMLLPHLTQLLEHYKYRDDVVLIDDVSERETEIVGASFAMIYLPAEDTTGLRVLNYLQAETPVITTETGAIREMGGDAMLYCDKKSIDNIADKMKLIYKDEKLRALAVSTGKKQLQKKLDEPGLVPAGAAFL